MHWIEPNYSKSKVGRSGDYFSSKVAKTNISEFTEYYDVLSNWRSSHGYPMQSMISYIRKQSLAVDSSALIVRRLKRLPSIVAKLRREKGMKLHRMEDVVGCRVIVTNMKDVYSLRDKFVFGKSKNIIKRERDYIEFPKESGYRGIHLIYKYNGAKTPYKGHFVELQLRSKVQHSWATAVEVVGTFTGQALKASQGEDDWKHFFKLVSVAFSDFEGGRLEKNSESKERLELKELSMRLGIIDTLKAFAVSTKHLGKSDKNIDYYLLVLDRETSGIEVFKYEKKFVEEASAKYAEFEKSYMDDEEKDVVLVAASSIENLKKAYPNYFADTAAFSKNLEVVLSARKPMT